MLWDGVFEFEILPREMYSATVVVGKKMIVTDMGWRNDWLALRCFCRCMSRMRGFRKIPVVINACAKIVFESMCPSQRFPCLPKFLFS